MQISNPDKVLFPDDGITKADLADHYWRMADAMPLWPGTAWRAGCDAVELE